MTPTLPLHPHRPCQGRYSKEDQVQIGRSMVFMRPPFLVAIERARSLRRAEFDAAATSTQRVFRGFSARQATKSARVGVTKVRAPGLALDNPMLSLLLRALTASHRAVHVLLLPRRASLHPVPVDAPCPTCVAAASRVPRCCGP
jgi:hypothetical protein